MSDKKKFESVPKIILGEPGVGKSRLVTAGLIPNKTYLKQEKKSEEIDKQKFNRENEQLSEPDFNYFQKNEQCKSFDFLTYANKLPQGTRGFLKDEELQAYCIERRQAWYGDKSLNFWTHLIVRLKTWRFVVVEFICKQSIANIRHRFQPLHQPRLPRN